MKPSKLFGNNKKSNLIVESKKQSSEDIKLQNALVELEDSEIDALFEAGRISQEEYEYIIDLRKKKKSRKKTQQEKFEERIRCDNSIITKVINLGRKFRVEDLLARGKFNEARKADINNEFSSRIDEQEYSIDDRTRDKQKEERTKQKHLEKDNRNRGRGRERDIR